MNKHTTIVIVASFVIAIPFLFAAWNIYAAGQLQFSGIEQERFNYFDMINDMEIKVYNPLPFYVTFNKIDVMMVFDQADKGIFSIQGATLLPSSVTTLEGKFSSETFAEAQYLSMHFDGMFSGATLMRIDPNKLVIVTEIHTPIMGMIPYSTTQQYSGLDFWEMMNSNND